MQDTYIGNSNSPASQFDTKHLKADIKKRSISGGAATIVSQGTIFVLKTASTIVLARLLVPSDFGLIAMVTAISGFAGVFGDIGLSMATIQRDEVNHDQISSLFWINVAVGAIITVLIIALAPIIAWFYREPQLKMIAMAMSITFFIGGLAVQHGAIMKRQMRFIGLASVQIISVIVGIVVGIVSALTGAGCWALVMRQIASSVTSAIGLWLLCDWRPTRPVMSSGVWSMLKFGSDITVFNLLNYFARNLDKVLIGRFLGAGPLGFYSKAYGLLMMPLRQINIPLQSVAIPTLSALSNDHSRYESYYLRLISLITFVSTPLVAFLMISSDELILIILGPQWAPASKIFAILGISGLIQPLYFTQGLLHISAGRSDRYLRWGLFGSSIIALSFIIGIPYGTIGVASAYAVATWLIIVPCMWYAGNSAGIELKRIFAAVSKNIAAGILSIITSLYFIQQLPNDRSAWIHLAIGFGTLSLTYCAYILVLYRNVDSFRELLDVLKTLCSSFSGNKADGRLA